MKNGSDYLHGGAAAMLVDVVGASALISAGVFLTGVSVEINVSYLDAAYADVGIIPPSLFFDTRFLVLILFLQYHR